MHKILKKQKKIILNSNRNLSVINNYLNNIFNGILDKTKKEIILSDNSEFLLPSPPYIVSADNNQIINTISELNYLDGSGPSNSSKSFKVIALGLLPNSGNITMSVDADFEISEDNGVTWQSSPILIAYISGKVNTSLIYKVRLKSGLFPDTYTGNITLSGANATPFNIALTGTVSIISYLIATGGVITQVGNFKVHEISLSETFIVTQLSQNAAYNVATQIEIFGGGGGSTSGFGYGSGGGSGGEAKIITGYPLTIGSYTTITGAGGLPESNGQSSSFDGNIALGGGPGGSYLVSPLNGGGVSGNNGEALKPISVGPNGFSGGNGAQNFPAACGGGGSGASENGEDGTSSGGKGGDGYLSTIIGVPRWFCGGGGGAVRAAIPGIGGLGGGGTGGSNITNGENGIINTGGGAGGDCSSGGGFTGGSGNIFVSYYSPI